MNFFFAKICEEKKHISGGVGGPGTLSVFGLGPNLENSDGGATCLHYQQV